MGNLFCSDRTIGFEDHAPDFIYTRDREDTEPVISIGDKPAWIFRSSSNIGHVESQFGSTIWPLESPDWMRFRLPHSFRDLFSHIPTKMTTYRIGFGTTNQELELPNCDGFMQTRIKSSNPPCTAFINLNQF